MNYVIIMEYIRAMLRETVLAVNIKFRGWFGKH